MKKLVLATATGLLIGATLPAAAVIIFGGYPYDTSEFEDKTVSVGVLTDPATKHHMNIIKLKNGHMMAVVPLSDYMALSKMSAPDDMLQ